MTTKVLVICVAIFGLVASDPTPLPNLCPQPTESDPVPPAFFYGHPGDCTQYFTCAHGQPILQSCSPGTRWSDFFQTCAGSFTHYDTCTRDNAQRECSRGATDLIPHPTACQRYYNCSDTATRPWRSYFGDYEDECTYPQLFDVHEKKCKPFKEANCGPIRRAAKDACEYLRNLCLAAHCRPCKTYPNCLGLDDGINVDRTRKWTPFFVVCDTERIINTSKCGPHDPTGTTGFYSPVKKTCVSIWEVPRSTGYGQAPTCEKGLVGKYRIAERPDVYYTCPGAEVSYCSAGKVFNEATGLCE